MIGIVSYGTYIPLWRLGKETAGWGFLGEKPVANWDEDAITMGVASALDCLDGLDRKEVDALFFAITSPPYQEKQGATIIAAACDLRKDILTTDSTSSLRGGTVALKMAYDLVKAGSAKKVLLVASDCRLVPPRSPLEGNLGDDAVALLIGERGSCWH